MDAIGRLTLYEYDLLMTGNNLKGVDDMHHFHLQAWLNRQVSATQKKGKSEVPVYKEFQKFFDYDKCLKKVMHQSQLPKDDDGFYDMLFRANL